MRDVAGTGRGGVSMAGGQLPARPRRKKGKRGEGQSLAITAMLCSEFAYVFRLFFLDEGGCREYPFYAHIYMNS